MDLVATGGVVCPFCASDRLVAISPQLAQCPACMFGRSVEATLSLRGGTGIPPFHGVNAINRPDLGGFAFAPSFSAMRVTGVEFRKHGYWISGSIWSSPPATAILSVLDVENGMVPHPDRDTMTILSAWWVRLFDVELDLGSTVVTPTGAVGRLNNGTWSQCHRVFIHAPSMVELPVLLAGAKSFPLPFVHGFTNRNPYTDQEGSIPGLCLLRSARESLSLAARRRFVRWTDMQTELRAEDGVVRHLHPDTARDADRDLGWKQMHPADLLLVCDHTRDVNADAVVCAISQDVPRGALDCDPQADRYAFP